MLAMVEAGAAAVGGTPTVVEVRALDEVEERTLFMVEPEGGTVDMGMSGGAARVFSGGAAREVRRR